MFGDAVLSPSRRHRGSPTNRFLWWRNHPSLAFYPGGVIVKVPDTPSARVILHDEIKHLQELSKDHELVGSLLPLLSGTQLGSRQEGGEDDDDTVLNRSWPVLVTPVWGCDLEQVFQHQQQMQRGQSLFDPDAVLRLSRELAATLAHLHQLADPVAHLDIKPENILVAVPAQYNGHCQPLDFAAVPPGERCFRLIDFGSAVYCRSQQQCCVVTPSYAPPEALRRRQGGFAPMADAWGLGALLYVLMLEEPLCFHFDRGGEPILTWTEHMENRRRLAVPPGAEKEAETLLGDELESRLPKLWEYAESNGVSSFGMALLRGLLCADPVKRMTCAEATELLSSGSGAADEEASKVVVDDSSTAMLLAA